jgi:hypothetical protein
MSIQLNLICTTHCLDQSLEVPEFPARNGPQRLVAAATKQPRNREKVRLEPGHSALDWAKLTASGKDLRVSWMNRTKSWSKKKKTHTLDLRACRN